MKTRNLIALYLVLLLVPFAQSQAPAPDAKAPSTTSVANPDPPSHDEVMEFMRLMHADRQVNMVMDQMQVNIRQGMRQGFMTKYPNASPAVLAKLDGLIPDFRKYVSVDDIMEVAAKIYAQNLTKRELAAASNFYKSPEGQQLLEKLPTITQQSMRAGGELMESHSQELMADIQARMDDLEREIKAEQKGNSAAQPGSKPSTTPKSAAPKSTTAPKK